MARSAVARSEIQPRGHWLLDLTLGGRLYRVAHAAVDVTDASGATLAYVEGLVDPLDVTLDLRQPPRATVRVSDAVDDWARLDARCGMYGEAKLYRWYEDQTMEQARCIVSGRVRDPSYQASNKRLEFDLQSAYTSRRTVPPPEAIINGTTFPDDTAAKPDPAVLGAHAPWIFGTPGAEGGGLVWGTYTLAQPASPAYIAQWGPGAATLLSLTRLVFADAPVDLEATTIRLLDRAEHPDGTSPTDWSEVLSLAYDTNLLGRRYAYVDISGGAPSLVRIAPGGEFYVVWTEGGGMLRRDRTGPMRGAGEIAEFLLEQGGVAVDRGRFAAARTRLDAFHLDFALVDPIPPEQWVEDVLGAVLPVCRQESDEGVWYELIRYDAQRQDVEARLVHAEAGATPYAIAVSQVGDVSRTADSQVANQILVDFGAVAGQTTSRRITLTGDPTTTDADSLVYASYLCAVSLTRHARQEITIPAGIVDEAATALQVAHVKARELALQRRLVTVEGGLDLDVLTPNSVVEYTHAGLYIDAEIALVARVTLGLDSVTVDLELLDQPETRARETA